MNSRFRSVGRLRRIFTFFIFSILLIFYTHLLNVFFFTSFSQKYRIDYIFKFAYNKSTTFAKFYRILFSLFFLLHSNISSIYFLFISINRHRRFFFSFSVSFNIYMLCHCQWLHWLKLVFHRIRSAKRFLRIFFT